VGSRGGEPGARGRVMGAAPPGGREGGGRRAVGGAGGAPALAAPGGALPGLHLPRLQVTASTGAGLVATRQEDVFRLVGGMEQGQGIVLDAAALRLVQFLRRGIPQEQRLLLERDRNAEVLAATAAAPGGEVGPLAFRVRQRRRLGQLIRLLTSHSRRTPVSFLPSHSCARLARTAGLPGRNDRAMTGPRCLRSSRTE